MLLEDPESALRDTRRVLKQNGRLALAAWTAPGENLWSAAPVKIMQARGILEKDEPGAPGQFAWADPETIVDTMETAGFIEPHIEAVDFEIHYDDVDDWWVAQTQLSTRIADADKGMDFATRSDVLADLERAAEPFLQPDDSLAIPARTWVATATA
jgi:SAM-dependent methyltransferase